MNAEFDAADMAALKEQGDLEGLFLALTGHAPPKALTAASAIPAEPDYVIPHRGAWPIGSAASGPTPTHGKCTCPICDPKGTP